jgi:hypothetical protein
MEATTRRPLTVRIRGVLRVLTAFAGLVAGICWLVVLVPMLFRDGPRGTTALAYLAAVLANWAATVIPSMVIPGLHTFFSQDLAARFGANRARAVSVALALAAWPLLLIDGAMRADVEHWGVPLAVLLFLFGWYRGGMLATGGKGTGLDRGLERLGIGLTGLFILGFVGTVAWSWFSIHSG